MKRLFDALFTAIVLLLVIPTTLILASWNAIPGDKLYSVKTGLEDVVVFVLSGTPLLPKASIKFTDRRLDEATTLLAKKGSTVGYDLLIAEAQQTQTYIAQKSDVQSGVDFSKNIDMYQKEIEKKKVEVKAQIQAVSNTTQTNPSFVLTPTPFAQPTTAVSVAETTVSPESGQTIVINKPEVVVIQHENPVEVLQKLEETQVKLEDIKKEVDKETSKYNQNNKDRTKQENR